MAEELSVNLNSEYVTHGDNLVRAETKLGTSRYCARMLEPVSLLLNGVIEACLGNALLTNVAWCCNRKYEVCVAGTDKFNVCETNFANPYEGVSLAEASSLKAAFLASSKTSARTLTTVKSAPPAPTPPAPPVTSPSPPIPTLVPPSTIDSPASSTPEPTSIESEIGDGAIKTAAPAPSQESSNSGNFAAVLPGTGTLSSGRASPIPTGSAAGSSTNSEVLAIGLGTRSASASISPSTTTQSSGTGTSAPSTDTASPGGLATAAIVGIVLGALTLLSLVAAVMYWLGRKKRADNEVTYTTQYELDHASDHGRKYLGAVGTMCEVGEKISKSELPSRQSLKESSLGKAELEDTVRRVELQS